MPLWPVAVVATARVAEDRRLKLRRCRRAEENLRGQRGGGGEKLSTSVSCCGVHGVGLCGRRGESGDFPAHQSATAPLRLSSCDT